MLALVSLSTNQIVIASRTWKFEEGENTMTVIKFLNLSVLLDNSLDDVEDDVGLFHFHTIKI